MQLAYAIGVAEPVSVTVNTFGTGVIADERFTELVRENFMLTPRGIIETLKLRRPIYRKTAAFGHFGRTEDTFTWEATDKAEALKEQAAALPRRPRSKIAKEKLEEAGPVGPAFLRSGDGETANQRIQSDDLTGLVAQVRTVAGAFEIARDVAGKLMAA